MILKSKLYAREMPSKEAKLIIIYCEGEIREYHYFKYFQEITSQLKLEIEIPKKNDNNSPTGLYHKAVAQLIMSKENPDPKYPLSALDEVWFVIDTDSWGGKITELRNNCLRHSNWNIAQSNPCFEVWLFYHFGKFQMFSDMNISAKWKQFLHQEKPGGFNSKRHSVFIKTAIENARNKFKEENEILNIGCTEVFKLAESFYPLVSNKIEDAINNISI